jgi:transposase-like protein
VLEVMKSAGVSDRVKVAAQTMYQALIGAELTAVIGAGLWEHSAERTGLRNGYRPKVFSTQAGNLELSIPKLRSGSFYPSLLERRRVDQALFAVVMEAYLHGVSTRKVDDLVKALGIDAGISKSEVSRICADLDVEVGAFRDRSLAEVAYPYVFLDATYCKARVNHRVVSQAVVIATGVTGDGRREVLGFDVGDSEDGAFWTAFLRSLKARGLSGVQLVISDAHTGLKQAIGAVMLGAAWQRCRVPFMLNVLAQVPRENTEMVAAAVRTVFAQLDAEHVTEQFETVAGMLGRQLPKVEQMMREARENLLAFTGFPQPHWRKIWSTNPRAGQPGGETPHRGGRRLPQPRHPAPPRRRRAGRDPRRVGCGQRTPLPLRSQHETHHRPDRTHPGGSRTRCPHGMINTTDQHRNSTTWRGAILPDRPHRRGRNGLPLPGHLRPRAHRRIADLAGLDQVQPRPHAGGAGVAGVMKVILALRHECMPQTLWISEPTSGSSTAAAVTVDCTVHHATPNARHRRSRC